MKCIRCGVDTPRLTLTQRYCTPCQREVDAKLAPKPQPAFVPEWLRHGTSKDMTGATGR